MAFKVGPSGFEDGPSCSCHFSSSSCFSKRSCGLSCLSWFQEQAACFFRFLVSASCPLALIFTDVWGPAPVCSRSGFKYYVSFLDAYSKYTWLYPICSKSDVSSIFLKFKTYVERFFDSKIKAVQSDWGGEYRP
jgi:hypothetical protein